MQVGPSKLLPLGEEVLCRYPSFVIFSIPNTSNTS